MKKEIENFAKKAASDIATKPISRKEAIKKTGYMAVSAATMMLLLNSPAQACSSQTNDQKSGNSRNRNDRNDHNNRNDRNDHRGDH